jgi:hypothetical protein
VAEMRNHHRKGQPLQLPLMGRRVIVWFSCGAASAIAAKYAVKHYENVIIVNCASTLKTEHPDNLRFMNQISEWIDRPILKLYSTEYTDIYDVFRKRQYITGQHGAPCTQELKRRVRELFQEPSDYHVFGYHASEAGRQANFERDNPDLYMLWPLIELGITKRNCLNFIESAGIRLPEMYYLGFPNNNCLGCVKSTSIAYWLKIYTYFPNNFWETAKIEREVGYHICKKYYLDELPGLNFLGKELSQKLRGVECGPFCTPPNTASTGQKRAGIAAPGFIQLEKLPALVA